MRLVSYGAPGAERPGLLGGGDIVVLDHYFNRLGLPPLDMTAVIGLLPHLTDDLRRELNSPHQVIPADSVRLGPPIPRPGKIFGIGKNYASPGQRRETSVPLEFTSMPPIFAKPHTAVIGPNDPIVSPPETQALDYEIEVAVVIGKTGTRIPAEHAGEHIAGLMIVNDVTAHDILFGTDDLSARMTRPAIDAQFLVGKGFDTFLPCGPWLLTADEGWQHERELSLSVSGELRQSASTGDMILSFAQTIEIISRFATLNPGDVIMTGTPAGGAISMDPPRFLAPGDVITASAAPDLGSMHNEVVSLRTRGERPAVAVAR